MTDPHLPRKRRRFRPRTWPETDREREEFAAESLSLWRITFAPSAWAIYFATCYGAIALACAKPFIPLGPVRAGLLGLTLLTLGFIGWTGWRAYRQWDLKGRGEFSNPEGRAEDRHHFLGHAAFLLALISAIGVIYTALPLIVLDACR